MNPEETTKKEVDQFILDEIDSVPHLEALLLLWNSRPKQWSLEEMSKSLYVSPETTQNILHDLERQSLVTSSENGFCYPPGLDERDMLLEAVDRTYRRELVRVSRMIHSKASPAVREFARAFRFKGERLMGPAVYILGVIVTFCCGLLLARAYSNVKKRLLLWSALCFFGLAVSNLLVFLDLVILPQIDLYFWRLLTAAASMLLLLYGLIWEGEK